MVSSPQHLTAWICTLTSFLLLFFFHPLGSAVGIQMKLEFFQRKFWTACRQVTNKLAPAWWKQNMKSPIVWEPSYLCFVYSAPLWTGSAASVAITRWEKSQTLWFSHHALIHLHWQFDPFTLLAGYQLLPHRQQRFHPRHRGAISGNPLTLWKVSHSLTHSPEQNVPQPFQDVLWSSNEMSDIHNIIYELQKIENDASLN